jgi:hypothetical protein
MSALGVSDDWLENGISKHVTIAITPAGVGMDVSMSIEEYGGTTVVPFAGVNIPGMTPYNGRWSFKGRTGGENQHQDIDNLVTTFDPAGPDPAIVTNMQDFDFVPTPPTPPNLVGGTPFAAAQHGSAPGATLVQDAPGTGVLPGHMQITNESGNLSNSIAFIKTSDIKKQVLADFDVRITDTGAAGSADGLAYMMLDTAVYGDSGPIPGGYMAFEEPNLSGVLGVALDTFSAGAGNPDFCADCTGNVGNSISLHFNGATLGEVTFPQSEIDLVAGVYHHMSVFTEEVPGGLEVTVQIVDGTDGSVHTPFANFPVAGGFTGGVRAAFGARTGGAADFYDIDNVNVAFIPEPSTYALAIVTALAGLGVARRRRRAAA